MALAQAKPGTPRRGPRRWPRIPLLVLALLAPPATAVAAKTDVVVLRNGDRITCEVSLLDRGKLRVKTDDMGTIDIEWSEVASVTGDTLFEVEDQSGELYLGSLEPGAVVGDLEVVSILGLGRVTVPLASVVRVQRLGTGFWQRLAGSIDAGFSHTSASRLTQFNLDGRLTFRKPKFQIEATASSIVTAQPEVENTERAQAELSYVRFQRHRRLVYGLVSAERNRELGFDLRMSVRGGWGSYLVRGQGNQLLAGIGLNLNQEDPVAGERTQNVEAVLGFDWAVFAYSSPKTTIEIQVLAFPSLSTWGRWRMESNARIERELFSDFFVSLKGYDSFDSQPGVGAAGKNDWGVTFGLGYSFS